MLAASLKFFIVGIALFVASTHVVARAQEAGGVVPQGEESSPNIPAEQDVPMGEGILDQQPEGEEGSDPVSNDAAPPEEQVVQETPPVQDVPSSEGGENLPVSPTEENSIPEDDSTFVDEGISGGQDSQLPSEEALLLEEELIAEELVEEEVLPTTLLQNVQALLDFLPIEVIIDFSMAILRSIVGMTPEDAIVHLERDGKQELWFVSLSSRQGHAIGPELPVNAEFPVGVKGNYIFWLSEDRASVFVFDRAAGTYSQALIPSFDPTIGERGIVSFENVPWKVIVAADNFYFFSEETGEVFSDGYSEVVERFRTYFQLDNTLTGEELGKLNLPEETYGY